ncbi:MAG TPA: asparagine synthase (glutamine-hydrolyzing) [Vicinamibacterales bacterium]|nr:asparagine synthase (glutamine-hydrolyzing) [Vicinamibacterales bacterium]
MCGIAGGLFWNSETGRGGREASVRRMVHGLAHRGPDGEGVVRCETPARGGTAAPTVIFGHRRLSIIDLSDRASQPMASPRAPIWLTYNGEIYNFRDVRRELEARGRTFHSGSDTEVILQGYEEWGASVVERLRGMFAFALWDGATQRLWLARDRLGIKPLYVYRGNGYVLFASEVRALLASGLVPRTLDRAALDQFLAYQSVPEPLTLVRDVRMLGPGHIVRVGADGREVARRYWDLLDSATAKITASPEDSRRRVRQLLEEATALHLVSDVGVGVFLSGGIDSGAIAALVRQAGVVPRTFSVAFTGTDYDESPYARAMARALQTNHTEISLSESDILAQIPQALASVDHPSGDGTNTFVIARAVREAGLKVALSGLGGDEFFGGYPSFRRLRRVAALAAAWRHSPAFMRRVAARAVRTLGGSSVASVKTAAVLESDGTLPQTFPLLRQLFPERQRLELLGPEIVEISRHLGDPYVFLLQRTLDREADLDLMSLVSYAEARTYMHDVLLRDTDQMSMCHGLEIRVPLLDHQLVEYLMSLPESAKTAQGPPKPLLTGSLDRELPAFCVARPKRGFVLPLDDWMRTSLRSLCEEQLGANGLAGRSIFRPAAVESVWRSFLTGKPRTTWSRPWALVTLNNWLDRTGVKE